MEDSDIERRMDAADQYRNRPTGLSLWEETAPAEEVKLFRAYLRVWLKKREAGATIGWKMFATICREDIPSFDLHEQAISGVLRERIKRL